MPIHEITLPVGAKQLSPNLPTITRSSKDGNIPVAKIFAGDNFVGDVLEGQWVHGADSIWTDPFTAKIASGQLDLAGAHSSSKFGWINGKTPFIMKQNCYIDVHMKVETVTPSNSFAMHFYLRSEESTDIPFANGDSIDMRIMRSGSTTYISGTKTVGGSGTSIYATTAITNDEGTFRFKFRPEDDLIDIYFHDGAGAVVESTDELTLLDDAFDFTFEMGYPAFEYDCNNTTNYTVSSEGVTASYSDMVVAYLQDVADIGKGDVKCYDTMGSVTESDWRRVYSEGHVFTGDCVIENGLIRLVVDEAAVYGLELYYWTGSAWAQPFDVISLYQDTDAKSLTYPFMKEISLIERAETIKIRVRVCESVTESNDYNAEFFITLARGKYHLTFEIDDVAPKQNVRFMFYALTNLRFQYCGDEATKGIGDDDLTLTVNNTTMTDNFLMAFDDAGSTVIGFIATNQKPNQFYSYQGDYISLYAIPQADWVSTEIHVGLIPYSNIVSLFKEAENGTTTGTSVIDATASGGYMVELDALDEYVYFELTGVTNIPVGKYKMIVRAKDTAQVADDLEFYVYNQTESRYMNEDRAESLFTATASYAFYSVVFEVTSVDSADTIRFYVNKGTATANTISVDYFLIVPISDGETFVQDIAHNEMRTLDVGFRVLDLASFEVFAGMGIFSSSLIASYTDAMAIAAIESAPTLDLSGILTASTIKTESDNEGLYIGSSDDLRIFHDGVNTYLKNNVGDMILQSLGGDLRLETADFFLDSTGAIQFRDSDDSDVVLVELDTTARTFQIGQAADLIETTHYGDFNLVGELLLEAATLHSQAGLFHIHPSTGNTVGGLLIHPLGTQDEAYLDLRTSTSANYGSLKLDLDGLVASLQSLKGGSGTAPNTLNLNDPDWDTINIGDGSATITIGGAAYPPAPASHDFDTHTGDVDLVDIASYVRGSIMIGGAVDWATLAKGTATYVLKMGADEPAWGQVDYSELAGTQPAPVVHNLVDTTGHPVTGLTAGHILTALTPTTYGFAVASGGITGSGTNNRLVKWLAQGSTIDDSLISQSGDSIIVNAPVFTVGDNSAEQTYLFINNSNGDSYLGNAYAASNLVTGSIAGDFVISARGAGGILLSADSAFAQKHLYISEAGFVTLFGGMAMSGELSGVVNLTMTSAGGISGCTGISTLQSITMNSGTITGFASLTGASIITFNTGANSSMYFDAGNVFRWRDEDSAAATRMELNSATGILTLYGQLNTYDISPRSNNTETVGTSTSDKFLAMYASSFNTGDIKFANGFILREVYNPSWDGDKDASDEDMWAWNKKDGATPALEFFNNRGESIALLDEDGDFHARGKIYEFSKIFKKPS